MRAANSWRFYGTQGTMTIRDTTSMPAFGWGAATLARGPMLTFTPQDTRPQPDSYSIFGWPAKLRDDYLQQWQRDNPLPQPGKFAVDQQEETYLPPAGYSDVVGHLANFFQCRSNPPARGRKRGLRPPRLHRLPHGQLFLFPSNGGPVGREQEKHRGVSKGTSAGPARVARPRLKTPHSPLAPLGESSGSGKRAGSGGNSPLILGRRANSISADGRRLDSSNQEVIPHE